MERTETKGSTGKGNAEGKSIVHGRKGKRDAGKFAGGGTWSEHVQQDFGRRSAGQHGKYGELKEVREEKEIRECGTKHKQNNNRWRGKRKESKSS